MFGVHYVPRLAANLARSHMFGSYWKASIQRTSQRTETKREIRCCISPSRPGLLILTVFTDAIVAIGSVRSVPAAFAMSVTMIVLALSALEKGYILIKILISHIGVYDVTILPAKMVLGGEVDGVCFYITYLSRSVSETHAPKKKESFRI